VRPPIFINVWLLLFSFISFLGGASFASAGKPEQIDFTFEVGEKTVLYKYVWEDSLGEKNLTSFSLLKEEVKVALQEFKAVDSSWDAGIEAIFLKKIQPFLANGDLEFSFTSLKSGKGPGFSYTLRGLDSSSRAIENLKTRIPTIYSLSRKEYAKQNFYIGEDSGNKFMLRPDYKALATRYTAISRIVYAGLAKSGLTAESQARRLLEFIQSIPYSREFTNKAEFQTPIGCYTENRGDCDTKTVALASLLSVAGIPWVIVALPEHMVLGIGVRAQLGDAVISHEGNRYVLAEPAGRGIPMGELAQDSAKAIKANSYFLIY